MKFDLHAPTTVFNNRKTVPLTKDRNINYSYVVVLLDRPTFFKLFKFHVFKNHFFFVIQAI